MNTIIALRGKGNSGKTTTIRLLHELLVQNDFTILNSNFYQKENDFSAVFTKNGVTIGVTSSGDTYDLVHNRLQELIDENCTICLCACRTFDRIPPGTNAAIIEFANFNNEFIEKTIDDNDFTQLDTNRIDAEELHRVIQNLI